MTKGSELKEYRFTKPNRPISQTSCHGIVTTRKSFDTSFDSSIDRQSITALSITMNDESLHPPSLRDNDDLSSSKMTKNHFPTDSSSLSKISKLDVDDPTPPRLPQAKTTECENDTNTGIFTSDITMNALDEQDALERLIHDLSKDEISLLVRIFGKGATSSTTTKTNPPSKRFPKGGEGENGSAFTRIVHSRKNHNETTEETSKPMLPQNQQQPHPATISPGVMPSLHPVATFQNPSEMSPWKHFHTIDPCATLPPHLFDLPWIWGDAANDTKKLDRSKPIPSDSEEERVNCNIPTNRTLANFSIINNPDSNERKVVAYISNPSKGGEAQWERMYEEAKAFVKENGHSRIPVFYPKNKALGQWAKRQRYHLKVWKKHFDYNKHDSENNLSRLHDLPLFSPAAIRRNNPGIRIVKCLMTPQRLEKLEAIDFCADLLHGNWDHQYKLLCEYASKHGGRTNPSKHTHMDLCKWAGTQRYRMSLLRRQNREKGNTKQKQLCYDYNNNDNNGYGLSAERVRKLDAINFQWECEYEVEPYSEEGRSGTPSSSENDNTETTNDKE